MSHIGSWGEPTVEGWLVEHKEKNGTHDYICFKYNHTKFI